jgi:hypothetical protein
MRSIWSRWSTVRRRSEVKQDTLWKGNLPAGLASASHRQLNASKVVDVDFDYDSSWGQFSNDDGCFFELSNDPYFPENTAGVLLDLDAGSIELRVNGERRRGYPAGSVTGPERV